MEVKLSFTVQNESEQKNREYRQLSLHRLGGTAGGVYLAAALGHSTNFSITDKLLRPSHRKPSHLRCQANPQTQVPSAVSNNPPDLPLQAHAQETQHFFLIWLLSWKTG